MMVCRIVYGVVVYAYMMIVDASADMMIFYALVYMMICAVLENGMMISGVLVIGMMKPAGELVVDMKMIDVAVFVDTRMIVDAENRMMVFSFVGMMVFDALACVVFHMMSPDETHHTDYTILVLVLIIAGMKDR